LEPLGEETYQEEIVSEDTELDPSLVVIPIADRAGGPAKSVRRFNPKRQPKTSKGAKTYVDTFNSLWDLFSKEATKQWMADFKIPLGIYYHSMGEHTLKEMISREAMISGIFNCPPLPGKGLFQLDLTIVMMIIDRLMGGQAVSRQRLRLLTEFELSVMKSTFAGLFTLMRTIFTSITQFTPEIEALESDPNLLPPISDSSTFLEGGTFLVKMKDYEGYMHFYFLPELLHAFTEPISRRGKGEGASTFSPTVFVKKMARMPIPVTAVLGEVELTFSELRRLRKDNIIVLEKSVFEDIDIRLHDTKKMKGRVGKLDEMKAVEIVGFVGEED
jgi:flagellar motor switch protein FliM